jgi:ABC-type transport system substrate-binding protein
MTTRRVLIFAPLILTLILVQSYFWVPTYEQQARGNPDRLGEFINGSIGDATLLNPILSAETASSEIESKVFEGLIDRDENLRFRGRLATSWKIYEEAYFYVNPAAAIPDLGQLDGQQVVDLLRRTANKKNLSPAQLSATLSNIRQIYLIAPQNSGVNRKIEDPANRGRKKEIQIEVSAPARVKLVLDQVDQDLFHNLTGLLGDAYFDSFKSENYVKAPPGIANDQLIALARELLPAVEHNPVIEFYLRSGVTFHDGHPFEAKDVKFTYESILDPKNLSPRVSDYEPVKAVEVLDPLTVRIVYKRLYSPAIGTWAMGILPEHRLNAAALEKEALRLGVDPATFSMRQSAFNRHPIGCGPFVFREWKSDQYIVLDRFEKYWEGPPNYEQYVFRVIPDLLTQEMEFYAGTLDSYSVQPHQVQRLEADPRFQHFSGTSFGYSYIGYNMCSMIRPNALPARLSNKPNTTTMRFNRCRTIPARLPGCWPKPAGDPIRTGGLRKTAASSSSP